MRLEREVEELAQTLKETEAALAQATDSLLVHESSSSTTTSTSKSHEQLTNSSKTKSTSRTSSALPEGGEVAQGVGVMVTINSKEKETVKSLQADILNSPLCTGFLW